MKVLTQDNVEVELAYSDAGYAPGVKGRLSLNTSCVWYRPAGGDWVRSINRGMIQTQTTLKSKTYEEANRALSADPMV